MSESKDAKRAGRCEDCEFFEEDFETGETYCSVSLDEDEMADFLTRRTNSCPYYRYHNEYKTVRKQN